MTTYAQRQDGVWRELRPTFPVRSDDGRQASWETFTALSVAEQQSLGGFLVPEPTTPEGKVETGRFLKPTGAKPSWDVTYADIPPPSPAPAPPPAQGGNVALADLSISGDDIGGIGQAAGVGFAMSAEPNVFWVFFDQPQPDAAYVTFAQATGASGSKVDADVSDQTTDYVEITVTDRLTAEPAVPSRLALSIMRAQ